MKGSAGIMVRRSVFALTAFVAGALWARSTPSEITIDLRLDASDFVAGERVRGVVDIANSSPDVVGIGGRFRFWEGEGEARHIQAEYNVNDYLTIEVYRSNDMMPLTKVTKGEMVANFVLESGEGQKLETFLGDHYPLTEARGYIAKPVFVHGGIRYEGQPRAFNIVEGVGVGAAVQMFATRKGLQREFNLVYWSKNHGEHLYLKAADSGTSGRRWQTRDLGPILRLDRPSVSVLSTGEIVILHRLNQDQFIRTEFWSLPDALEFRTRETVSDPETAGTARVRELYRNKGVQPKENPWWKFW